MKNKLLILAMVLTLIIGCSNNETKEEKREITPIKKNSYSFFSYIDSNGKPIDFPSDILHAKSLSRTYVKVWAVIIWDEAKENVLYYKKLS